jgi:hypothetical protein
MMSELGQILRLASREGDSASYFAATDALPYGRPANIDKSKAVSRSGFSSTRDQKKIVRQTTPISNAEQPTNISSKRQWGSGSSMEVALVGALSQNCVSLIAAIDAARARVKSSPGRKPVARATFEKSTGRSVELKIGLENSEATNSGGLNREMVAGWQP